jgi:hypothetical protein
MSKKKLLHWPQILLAYQFLHTSTSSSTEILLSFCRTSRISGIGRVAFKSSASMEIDSGDGLQLKEGGPTAVQSAGNRLCLEELMEFHIMCRVAYCVH